ncbi:nuclear transport factor 2 family protein [Jiulongibacter sp. NS-SX5]|uniref:nuclear transport factor 2 family protein n=1 Tax=Jiulongibacter sp. NS-SX5 TaxID=3463854 RepID=UPI0040590B74
MSSLLKTFYNAFSEQDAETMASCYDQGVVFEDPAFGKLTGKDAADMWRMLCQNATDLKVNFEVIHEDNQKGLIEWQAEYTFRKTGRKVLNKVIGKFVIRNGKIISHEDSFNLHTWATQAMGFQGKILGGTKFFQNKLQKSTKALLRKFQQRNH